MNENNKQVKTVVRSIIGDVQAKSLKYMSNGESSNYQIKQPG